MCYAFAEKTDCAILYTEVVGRITIGILVKNDVPSFSTVPKGGT